MSHSLNSNIASPEALATSGSPGRTAARGEIGWLMAIAAGFMIVHIVAGTICLRAATAQAAAPPNEQAASLYD